VEMFMWECDGDRLFAGYTDENDTIR